MKNTFFFKLFTISTIVFFFAVQLYTQDISGGHRGNITALIHKGDEVISSGDDGFIVIWNIDQRAALMRFQLTTYKIEALVSHPQKDEICIVEAGGPNNYRISAWNYRLKQKLFSVRSAEPVTFINYSARGSFIIAAGLNGSPLALLDSETGRIVDIPGIPAGSIAFAATGRSERNMLLYQTEYENNLSFESSFISSVHGGQILYLDLDSGSVTSHFQAPGNLSNPVIFNNNSFIAGINSDGLLLIDAASGAVFDSIENIDKDALLYPSNNELYCLSRSTLYRFSVNADGKLATRQEQPLSFDTGPVTAFVFNGSAVFASVNGGLFILGPQNTISPMTHNFQTRITEIAAGRKNIAALTEDGDLCFIPLDYRLLRNQNITLVKKDGYGWITHFTAAGEDQFILWQSANTRYTPQIITADLKATPANFLTGRFPLRAISSLDSNGDGNSSGKLLVLDTAGNLSVYNADNISAGAGFTFSSAGAVDAAFVNDEYIILCRSAINNNSPFLFINYKTGETVPVFYGARTALTVTAGKSGNVYAETAEHDGDGYKTVVIKLSLDRGGAPATIFEYPQEAARLSIAESAGRLAVACDSEGAFFIADETISFERTSALPVKLLGCDEFFLSLDSEGNIAWHDSNNGKVLAVFNLRADQWILQNKGEISGRLSRRPD